MDFLLSFFLTYPLVPSSVTWTLKTNQWKPFPLFLPVRNPQHFQIAKFGLSQGFMAGTCMAVTGHVNDAAISSVLFKDGPRKESDLQYAISIIRTAGWQVYELKMVQNQRPAWFWNLLHIYCFLSLSCCGSKADDFLGRYLCTGLFPSRSQNHDKPGLAEVLVLLCPLTPWHTRPPHPAADRREALMPWLSVLQEWFPAFPTGAASWLQSQEHADPFAHKEA